MSSTCCLQVLDDGRLTDGQGRTVDFKNVLIIMTSNLGAEYLADGGEVEDVREQVFDVVRSRFRPEFLNRLDEMLIFRRLTREQMDVIVDIQIGVCRSCSTTARSRSISTRAPGHGLPTRATTPPMARGR